MIRVLHVMGRMAPGGTEHQLIGMLEAAHRHHWDATLAVLSSGWALTERVRRAGIPVLEIEGVTKADPRRALSLRRLGQAADVVHASLPLASAFARLSNLGPRRPALVVSERGIDLRRQRALGAINRVLRPTTDAYIGNSTAVTDFIRSTHGVGAGDSRVFEIPNGLDTDIFHPNTHSIRPNRGRVRLIGVGRLIRSKRFDLAVSLLPTLTSVIDAELVLVGDGPERTRLEQLARGLPVTFLGHVSDREELSDVLRSADILVMPSESEGYPNAVLEALACGLPVVAADIPGNRAAAGEGVRLVDDDADSWCRAIVDALQDGPVSVSRVAGRVLSFDQVALRHLDVFKMALDRRHRLETARPHQTPTGMNS
jgi:glycosyltransferase involved in cell wall biosynthesis